MPVSELTITHPEVAAMSVSYQLDIKDVLESGLNDGCDNLVNGSKFESGSDRLRGSVLVGVGRHEVLGNGNVDNSDTGVITDGGGNDVGIGHADRMYDSGENVVINECMVSTEHVNENEVNEVIFDDYVDVVDGENNILGIDVSEEDTNTANVVVGDDGVIMVGRRRYKLFNRLLCVENKGKWLVIVPNVLREVLIKWYHEELGHFGAKKVTLAILENFVWFGIYKDVRVYVSKCDDCQRVKHPSKYLYGPRQSVLRDAPNKLVCVDLFGPLVRTKYGCQYILVTIDVFSKYVRLYPLKKATARACLRKIMDDYVEKVGKPEEILSDHGTQFTSKLWRQGMEEKGIKVLYSSIRYPEGNPCERVMQSIGRILRCYVSDKHTAWYDYIGRIEHWVHSNGSTPGSQA